MSDLPPAPRRPKVGRCAFEVLLCALLGGCASDSLLQTKEDASGIPTSFDGVCSSWFPVDGPHQRLVYEVEGWNGWATLTVESGLTETWGGESVSVLRQTMEDGEHEPYYVDFHYRCDGGDVYYVGRSWQPDTACPGEPLPTGGEVCNRPLLEWSDTGFVNGGWVGEAYCVQSLTFYLGDCASREAVSPEPYPFGLTVEREWTVGPAGAVETEYGTLEGRAVDLRMRFFGSGGMPYSTANFVFSPGVGVVSMDTGLTFDRDVLTYFHQFLTDVMPLDE